MTELPVYCCCDPNLHLGYLQVREDAAERACVLEFICSPMLLSTHEWWKDNVEDARTIEYVRLEVAQRSWVDEEWIPRRQWAVKSMDVPIDKLRRLPGWRDLAKELAHASCPVSQTRTNHEVPDVPARD